MVGAFLRETSVAGRAQASRLRSSRSWTSTPKRDLPASSLTLPDRKRLEVARALATRPKLLLLDEVMAGLRPTECDQMVEVFRDLNRTDGLTILLIEHVMRAVMALAQHIVRAAPRRGHRARHARRSGARSGGAGVLPRRGDRGLIASPIRDLDLFYGDAQALDRVSLEVPRGRDRRHRRRQRRRQVVADPDHRGHREAALRKHRCSRTRKFRTGNRTRSATSASARSPRAGRCSRR